MANFFSNLFSKGATGLVDAVGDILDNSFTTEEEQQELENELSKAAMRHEAEMGKLALEDKKASLADIASARENQSRVQESEHASWLAKNVHSLLAVSIIALTFLMYFWIIQGDMKAIAEAGVKDIVIYILGALTTISTQVVAYYFGSSMGSQTKQKSMDKIAEDMARKMTDK
ncbi:hypothetical protein SG34_020045 [Thalassomonas viridans]|uniref:TMhelix containing protein n=1 Tax=Thalassomonas viridans TaxID=137584 RepID=A0AAE9YYQ5_9GAMM|nr:hypothetical protein [Thalassomonas viridans]WDE03656.1 hypothetical protein SG34_020045 [Thalassomonas viridans]